MTWYYELDQRQMGPVNEAELEQLVERGVIQPATLVWRSGMEKWRPYSAVPIATGAILRVESPEGTASCVQCGVSHPTSEMVQFGEACVCALCKPAYAQRLLEGTALPRAGHYRYAGFWIRFLAVILDGIILFILQVAISIPIQFIVTPAFSSPGYWLALTLTYLVEMSLAIGYDVYFLTRHSATPGKMACSLVVIRSDGSRITAGRAVGRYFAKMVSSLILLIGFIIAAFDDEKRSLHDRICDTRVIYK
jgi:uncharacterized RDD family membrane protein YckC